MFYKRVLYTLLCIFIFRLGCHIPIPGANLETLKSLYSINALFPFGFITGNAIDHCSAFSLGLIPYLTTLIVFMLCYQIPLLKNLFQNHDQMQLIKYLTVFVSILQSYLVIQRLKVPISGYSIIQVQSEPLFIVVGIISMTTGTMFLLWLAEIINKKGLGKGIHIIILSSIASSMPTHIEMLCYDPVGKWLETSLLLFIFFLPSVAIISQIKYKELSPVCLFGMMPLLLAYVSLFFIWRLILISDPKHFFQINFPWYAYSWPLAITLFSILWSQFICQKIMHIQILLYSVFFSFVVVISEYIREEVSLHYCGGCMVENICILFWISLTYEIILTQKLKRFL